MAPISHSEAEKLAKEIHAHSYVECSALTQKNLSLVFEEACKAVFADHSQKTSKEGKSKAKGKDKCSLQ
jgi:hypothetical protein